MSLMFENAVMDIIAGLVTLVAFLLYWSQSTFDYWKKRGIRFLKPLPLFGNMLPIATGQKSREELFQDFYNHEEFKNEKYGGIFSSGKPVLFAKDPDFIKQILIRDFDHFSDRGLNVDASKEPLRANLFNLRGSQWRELRAILTPTFTSGKIKMMYDVMNECADVLEKVLEEPASRGEILNVKETLSKFAMDIFRGCVFGLEIYAMRDHDLEFTKVCLKTCKPSFMVKMKRLFILSFPNFASFFRIRYHPIEVINFFANVSKQVVDYREKNNVRRNDFMQLLIDIKNKGNILVREKSNYENEEDGYQSFEMTDDLIAAQAFAFFIAGFGSSALTMSFALYELARNPDVQEKLVKEIREAAAKEEGKFTYESIKELKYLDMVISEALRKYPVTPFLVRGCTKDYKIEGTDIYLDTSCKVFIPLYNIQRDPKYYPNPDKFIPERFTPEEKAKRHPAVYMPFGEGPRQCIGIRFGLLQVKIGLATAIKNYSFEVCEKTLEPKEFDKIAADSTCTEGVWLRIKNRQPTTLINS